MVSLPWHSWIHGVLQRADRNKDNKMSFREVKSMLRMINIDMDDVYAYKLFKVPVLCSITRCPPLLSPGGNAGSFSAFPSAENCPTRHTQSHPPSLVFGSTTNGWVPS